MGGEGGEGGEIMTETGDGPWRAPGGGVKPGEENLRT